jgi:membrane-associated phospholipid phosphatase
MNSKINSSRNLLLPTLARTSPVVCPILLFMNCIIYPSFNSFYIFIVYILTMLLNYFEKVLIFKPLYKLLDKTTLPILGRGLRPEGANSCTFILDGKDAKQFGMPSGHSQLAWTLATYFICRIIVNFKNKNDNDDINDKNKTILAFDYIWVILSCIFLIMSAWYISYSRVYIEGCHTIQQVIIGGILGICGGFIIYYFEDNIKSAFNL